MISGLQAAAAFAEVRRRASQKALAGDGTLVTSCALEQQATSVAAQGAMAGAGAVSSQEPKAAGPDFGAHPSPFACAEPLDAEDMPEAVEPLSVQEARTVQAALESRCSDALRADVAAMKAAAIAAGGCEIVPGSPGTDMRSSSGIGSLNADASAAFAVARRMAKQSGLKGYCSGPIPDYIMPWGAGGAGPQALAGSPRSARLPAPRARSAESAASAAATKFFEARRREAIESRKLRDAVRRSVSQTLPVEVLAEEGPSGGKVAPAPLQHAVPVPPATASEVTPEPMGAGAPLAALGAETPSRQGPFGSPINSWDGGPAGQPNLAQQGAAPEKIVKTPDLTASAQEPTTEELQSRAPVIVGSADTQSEALVAPRLLGAEQQARSLADEHQSLPAIVDQGKSPKVTIHTSMQMECCSVHV